MRRHVLSLAVCQAIFAATLLIPLEGAASQEWAEKRNQEVAGAKHLGWTFEVPSEWASAPGPAPYPLSETYISTDGKTSFQVAFIPTAERFGSEQLALESRGYSRSETRLGGREATLWTRGEKIYYVTTPQGYCRVRMAGTADFHHTIDSFRFLALGGVDKTWTPTSFALGGANWTVDAPASWKFAKNTWRDGSVKLTVERMEADKTRSLRGLARNTPPGEGKGWRLSAFEPLENDLGQDGYLAIWAGPSGVLELAYFQFPSGVVRFQVYKADRDEGLRVVRSLHPTPVPSGP